MRNLRQARVHGRCRILPARCIETELNERQELVERLVLRWPAGKTAGQVVRAVLKGQAPVQRFDGRNKDALELAGRWRRSLIPRHLS